MTRNRIRDRNPSARNRRASLWGCISGADLTAYKVIAATEAWYVVASDEDIEKLITSEPIRTIFNNAGFEILTPPGFNSKRTVVLRRVDEYLTTHNVAEIKASIEENNSWARVAEVVKIPNFDKLLKIRFTEISMAKKAKTNGLLLLHQSIPAKNIEQETFINLVPCYICYSYEHEKKDCPTKNAILCSECGANNHTYRNCHSDVKRCLNCDGPHWTLAAICPTRKELIKERGNELRKRNRSATRIEARGLPSQASHPYSYATAVGPVPPTTSQANQQPLLTGHPTSTSNQIPLPPNAQAVILSAICFAHYMEYLHPGSFQANIDKMYDRNNIPRVLFPEQIDTSGLGDALQRDNFGDAPVGETPGQQPSNLQSTDSHSHVVTISSSSVSAQASVQPQDVSVKRKYALTPPSPLPTESSGMTITTFQLDAPVRAPKKPRQYAESVRPTSLQPDSDSYAEQQEIRTIRPPTPRKLDLETKLTTQKSDEAEKLPSFQLDTDSEKYPSFQLDTDSEKLPSFQLDTDSEKLPSFQLDTENLSQTSTVSTASRDTDVQPKPQRLSMPPSQTMRKDYLMDILKQSGLEFFKDSKIKLDPHKSKRELYKSRRIKYQFSNPDILNSEIKHIIEKNNISLEHIPINNIPVKKFLDMKEGFVPSRIKK